MIIEIKENSELYHKIRRAWNIYNENNKDTIGGTKTMEEFVLSNLSDIADFIIDNWS